MEQESLFDVPPERDPDREYQVRLPTPDDNRIGGFHRPASGAPETERLAAIAIYPRSGTARRRVLDFIANRGDRGATAEECALALEMRHYTAAPRITELKQDGWVEQRGIRATETGAGAAVWVLTERACGEWEPA